MVANSSGRANVLSPDAMARMVAGIEAQADNTRLDAGPAIILNMAGLMLTAHRLALNPTPEGLRMVDKLSRQLMGKADELGSWARTQIMIEADHAAST